MTNEVERKVLDMVAGGQISAEEGLRLINAMNGRKEAATDVLAVQDVTALGDQVGSQEELAPEIPQIPEEELKRMERLKRWWFLPFGLGLIITILGAIWMYMGYMAKGFGFGFWLAWIPFLLGIFVLAVSYQSSKSVWLHVRIKQKPGEKPERISISLPLPLSLTRWVISTFGDRIPGMKDQPIEEYTQILRDISPDAPFYVHVDEGDGEEVEVFIG